jgi:choline monooxygenase
VAGLPSGTAQATLPWSWYSDPELLRREQERIFRSAWHYAGPAELVAAPGDHLSCRVGDVPVLVVRDRSGTLRALPNVRRFRPGLEAEGAALLVEARGPLVFVKADPAADPLAETLDPLLELLAEGGIDIGALRFRQRSEYELECNWKVAVENYLECYHCPVAHPGFSAVVDVAPDAYRLEERSHTSSQFGPLRPGLDGGRVSEGQFHWLWPVTKLYAMPGPPNLAAGPVAPLGTERTWGFLDYFFPEDVSDTEVEELLTFDDQVGREDRGLVESVQRGMRSGMIERGRVLPESERLLAHFQRLVREALD